MNPAEIEKKLEEFRNIGKASFYGHKPPSQSTDDSAYFAHMQAALATISRPDYPAGMIPWLGEAHPDLYNELTARLPDLIHRFWEERAPLAEFDVILARLVETHCRACDLYRIHRQNLAQGVLASPQGAEQAK